MSPRRLNPSSCPPAYRSALQSGRVSWAATLVAGGLVFSLWSVCLARGAASLAAPTPPPAPRVPPTISVDDAADRNGNRIDDVLDTYTGSAGELSIASAPELVAVEMIFREPVTQPQIDEFLRLGGRITYLYRAVSYGWNGLMPAQNVKLLPSAMGPALVRVEAPQSLEPYLDRATQVGRVRTVWKPGFAGSSIGFSGDPNTTIAFLGSGADASHTDLQNRCSYWRDFTGEDQATPVDYSGHETTVISVAVGTGAAAGASAGPLNYTETSASPGVEFLLAPFSLPASYSTVRTIKTQAFWTGDMAGLCHMTWRKGTDLENLARLGYCMTEDYSPRTLTNTTLGSAMDVYGGFLLCVSKGYFDPTSKLEDVVVLTTITPYPAVGDGYNRLQGVAPNCRWCAVKVYTEDGYATTHDFAAGLDDLVLHRVEKNIKIINVSHGLKNAYGLPGESSSTRSKIGSAVENGIVVVAAAGNGAEYTDDMTVRMADPGRAATVLTVGAANDEGTLTSYSTYGFLNPRPSTGEDFKPDVLAPGGSWYYSAIFAAESNTSDGKGADKVPNDYTNISGTSLSAAFASGCAALVIDALQQRGIPWTFASSEQPRYVKMLLCATASETNAQRESRQLNPTLNRASPGPEGFPAGKDRCEGYGLINLDAAVEAVSQTYALGTDVTGDLGSGAIDKRVWARAVNLAAGQRFTIILTNPAGADFDLYLYSAVPSETGAPVILASSTATKAGDSEALQYAPTIAAPAWLVVKRVSGSGTFTLRSF
jgi:hypothetical protein